MGACKYNVDVTVASQVHHNVPEWTEGYQAWNIIYTINDVKYVLWAAFEFGNNFEISFDGKTWTKTVPFDLEPLPHDDYERDPVVYVDAPMQWEAVRQIRAKIEKMRASSKGSRGLIKWTFEGTRW